MKSSSHEITLILGLVLACNVFAQDESPIIAARPSFSSTPIALTPTTLQIESGYHYLRDDDIVDLRDQTLPLALMHVGLFERVELQVSWAGHS